MENKNNELIEVEFECPNCNGFIKGLMPKNAICPCGYVVNQKNANGIWWDKLPLIHSPTLKSGLSDPR